MSLSDLLLQSSQRSHALHRQFLHMRSNSLLDMRALIELQMRGEGEGSLSAIFDSRQLDEFGTGRISRCLGPDFARYDGIRIPRIPNGELKMMSRVMAITGTPRDPGQPAAITVEYDSLPGTWYYHDSAYTAVPYVVLMETALQPCGFLSAYLDSYALVPHREYFFRNLDGSARLFALPDLRGQTITTQARLLNNVVSGGTVIQKYAFELSCSGQVFYAGESTFGYFAADSMANQVGLDGGQRVPVAIHGQNSLKTLDLARLAYAQDSTRPHLRLSRGYLSLLDEVIISPQGGNYHQGYGYARRKINPRDWFYPYHFHGDPVMPGSLGVEAMLEAMQGYALAEGLGNNLRSPYFSPAVSAGPVSWRYRGQIKPQHNLMELEVHLKSPQQASNGLLLTGDASLWIDGLRIYEVQNLGLGIYEV